MSSESIIVLLAYPQYHKQLFLSIQYLAADQFIESLKKVIVDNATDGKEKYVKSGEMLSVEYVGESGEPLHLCCLSAQNGVIPMLENGLYEFGQLVNSMRQYTDPPSPHHQDTYQQRVAISVSVTTEIEPFGSFDSFGSTTSSEPPERSNEGTPHPCPEERVNPVNVVLSSAPFPWKKGNYIGGVTTGPVYRCLNLTTGEVFAIKEMTLNFAEDHDAKQVRAIHREIRSLTNHRHPNILRYYGVEYAEGTLRIFTEFVGSGSLDNMLQTYGPLASSTALCYLRQLLSAVAHLHSKSVLHRDIRPNNVLLTEHGSIKLADFASATNKEMQPKESRLKGSVMYMAPEVMTTETYTPQSDLWSVACTFLEMLTGHKPWPQEDDQSPLALMFSVGSNPRPPIVPSAMTPMIDEFFDRAFQLDPIKRGTAASLLSLVTPKV